MPPRPKNSLYQIDEGPEEDYYDPLDIRFHHHQSSSEVSKDGRGEAKQKQDYYQKMYDSYVTQRA